MKARYNGAIENQLDLVWSICKRYYSCCNSSSWLNSAQSFCCFESHLAVNFHCEHHSVIPSLLLFHFPGQIQAPHRFVMAIAWCWRDWNEVLRSIWFTTAFCGFYQRSPGRSRTSEGRQLWVLCAYMFPFHVEHLVSACFLKIPTFSLSFLLLDCCHSLSFVKLHLSLPSDFVSSSVSWIPRASHFLLAYSNNQHSLHSPCDVQAKRSADSTPALDCAVGGRYCFEARASRRSPWWDWITPDWPLVSKQ